MALVTENENTDICLFGDFNARTSNLDDTLSGNEDVFHNLNIDTDILYHNNSQNIISIPDRPGLVVTKRQIITGIGW